MIKGFFKSRKRRLIALITLIIFLAGFVYSTFILRSEVKADSLLRFNEGYGSTVFDSSGSASGTITGSTWKSEDLCKRAKCLYFDGSDWISFGDESTYDYSSSADFTISFWFRHSTASAAEVIIQKYEPTGADGGYRIRMESDGDISFGVDDANGNFADDNITSTAANYDDNHWHFVSAVKDSTTGIYLYIDTQQVASDTTIGSTGDLTNNDTFYIGDSDATDNGDEFVGFLDEVKIYTTSARTEAEVKSDMLQTSPDRGTSASFGPDQSWLSDGLVGYWSMDETSSPSLDSSGNGNSGTWTNSPTSAGGKFSNSISLASASSRYINLASATPTPTSAFTISAWIKPTSLSAEMGIVGGSTGGNFLFDVLSTGTLVVCNDNSVCSNTATSTTGVITTATWQHAVVTHDGAGNYRFYVNGTDVTSDDGTGDFSSTASNRHIGRGNSFYFNGEIDEVRIYTHTLTPNDIQKLYNWAPGPVAYWKFDEGNGSTVYDNSGNANTGTLTDMNPASDWVDGEFGKALDFDGTNDFINAGDNSLLHTDQSKSQTFSFWMYPRDITGTTDQMLYLYDDNDGHDGDTPGAGYYYNSLFITSTGTLRWNMGGDSNTSSLTCSSIALSDNTWFYISVVRDTTADTQVIYVNGSLCASRTDATTGTWETTGQYFQIGGKTNTNFSPYYWYFNGIIDDFKVYNYARIPAQIIEDMNAGHPAPGSPVGSAIVEWKFNEGYGDTTNNTGSGGSTYNGNIGGASTCPGASDCPAWTNSGKYDKALTYTVADRDYVQISGLISSPTNITLSAWVNVTALDTGGGTVISLGDSAAIQVFSTFIWGFYYDGTDWHATQYNTSITGTGWKHIAYVNDDVNNKQRLYLNGNMVNEKNATGSISYTLGTNTFLGKHGNAETDKDFGGQIDEVKVFSSALSADQVKQLYNQGQAEVFGSTSTDSSNNPSWSSTDAYCPPGQGSACTAPFAEWKFDEKTNLYANDTTTTNNRMQIQGTGGGWTNGILGSAGLFEGSNYYNTTTMTDLSSLNAFTISAWIYPTSLPASTYKTVIFSHKPGGTSNYYIQTYGTELEGGFYAASGWRRVTTSGLGLQTNQWYFVTYQFDTASHDAILYVNGVKKQTTNLNFTPEQSMTQLDIGNDNGFNEYWSGKIDEVKIYNYIRNPAQIAWDYNQGAPVAWWKFNECSGSSAYDTAPKADPRATGNTGTITEPGGGSNNAGVGLCSVSAATMWNGGATGKRGASLEFDGTDDYIDLGTSQTYAYTDRPFSVSVWTKLTDFSSETVQNAVQLKSNATEPWHLILSNQEAGSSYKGISIGNQPDFAHIRTNTPENLLTGAWHHVVVTYNGSGATTISNYKIYLDTTSLSLEQSSNYGTGWAQGNLIGACCSAADNRFKGQIDDVKIWNYALTDQQIRDDYNQGAVRFGP